MNNIKLASLIGSPKQIKWAEDIRETKMRFASQEYKELAARVRTSRWWIDHRGETITIDMLQEALADEELVKEEQEEVERRERNRREWDAYQRKVRRGEISNNSYLHEKFGWEPTRSHRQKANVEEESTTTTDAPKASEWGKVAINTQNVECTVGRAVQIKMPHSSEHDGYCVWVSVKLLRKGRHSHENLLSVKGDMTFTLKKYGSGRWNKSQVIATKTISAAELAEAFGGWVGDAPRYSEPAIDPDKEEIVKHEPAPLEPVEIEADPELIR